jgi:Uma2 family endonuclease
MSRALETVAHRHFTVEEYHRMSETGILSHSERVELVRGVIREMSPKNRAHVIATNRMCDLLRDKLKGRARVYKEDPLRVDPLDSEPEPDVMVCANTDVAAFGTDRMKPMLVIEVAESSLRYDLNDKATLYAEANIPEYWVVNLLDHTLEVFLDLGEDGYRRRATLSLGERIKPAAWPDLELEASSLFPEAEPDGPAGDP